MHELLIVLLFILGLLFIIKSADFLIEACIALSSMTGVSQVVMGATLVSLATALPELFVSLIAIQSSAHHLAVGNAVGSMICNVALVLGFSILIAPQKIDKNNFQSKAAMLIFLNFLLLLICLNFKVGLVESVLLIALYGVFFYMNVVDAKKTISIKQKAGIMAITPKKEMIKPMIQFLIGTTGIFFGATMLVKNGQLLADILGIAPEIVGLTFLAFGTSLPELITTITAVKKHSIELAFGNIIGANIINITLLFGLGGLIAGGDGLIVPKTSVILSIPILICMTLILMLPILKWAKTYRIQGIILILLYVAYIVLALSTSIFGVLV